ncbi:YceI family protein [Pyxidicoccus parkwayensis]|uniref:YceI family protein n=1 Tax=Pyxidicoccus parkwayensis TaxID=2813578 RepID=A0ABX7NT16_9BACT|nr:YceI family protein [Pyxidicoccus parkwaysis]QSQ21613.1 YceI family protein [Pyxidicoccus parkwaysis]
MISRRLALLATLLLALPVAAQGPDRKYLVKKDASSVTYKLKHKLHEVVGTAKPSTGIAVLKSTGTLQVQVRANVKDFDSGNSNRDSHMQEVTEAAKFPLIEFKGKADGVKMPTSFPATVPVSLTGQLTFHGVTQDVTVPMTVVFTSEKEATASGAFDISLEGYKIERPSLLMVKVDDKLVLEPKLTFVVEGT